MMKKHVLFITLLSALMLACSSHNGADQKARQDTFQSDSIKDTLASDFEDLLTYFTSKDRDTLPIPDKYCYEFFGMDKNELYYSYEENSQDNGDQFTVDTKEVVGSSLMKQSKNYVLLVYSTSHEDGGEWGHSDCISLKSFTPKGKLIQSLYGISNFEDAPEIFKVEDFYFKNDTTLYLIHLTPGNEEEPFENDSTSNVELTRYSVLSNGHLSKTGYHKFEIQKGFFAHDENPNSTAAVIDLPEKERFSQYDMWIEEAEDGK